MTKSPFESVFLTDNGGDINPSFPTPFAPVDCNMVDFTTVPVPTTSRVNLLNKGVTSSLWDKNRINGYNEYNTTAADLNINTSPTIKPKEAVKFDEGKTDWSLVPFEALEGMADVLTFGSKKYASWNWTENGGFPYMRVMRSCLRHLFAFMRGEDNDPESGFSHISHAQCNLLFLAFYLRNKEKYSKDDRNVR